MSQKHTTPTHHTPQPTQHHTRTCHGKHTRVHTLATPLVGWLRQELPAAHRCGSVLVRNCLHLVKRSTHTHTHTRSANRFPFRVKLHIESDCGDHNMWPSVSATLRPPTTSFPPLTPLTPSSPSAHFNPIAACPPLCVVTALGPR